MAPLQAKSGLFVGINKGHVVTKRELPPRPSHRKGVRLSYPNSAI
jgi:large subunit ribosomal protein L36e